MATIDEIRKARLSKLKVLEKAGLLAYPGELKRTVTAKEAVDQFSKLSRAKKEVIATGRIRAIRVIRGIGFGILRWCLPEAWGYCCWRL